MPEKKMPSKKDNPEGKVDKGLTYRDAGVDIEAGNQLVTAIKSIAASTRRAGAVGGIGGFGALFDLAPLNYRDPLLVASTDGVGTKLRLLMQYDRHESAGLDLVAMCVNDILAQGAEPLFFLDYLACGHLQPETVTRVLRGIASGCRECGMALVGGETAELPGMYQGGDYDLAGFAVGVVERARVIDGSAVCPGDHLLALASNGPHANGYALIQRVLEKAPAAAREKHLERLLTPTRIYADALRAVAEAAKIHGLAHITGGGLPDNLPRMLPPHCRARLQLSTRPWPEIFRWLATTGKIEKREMLRTFNCGIGMVVCVAAAQATAAQNALQKLGLESWRLGKVEPRPPRGAALCFA